ncbi:MAG TPA: zinc ribbon domain-containing protein [Bacillota bacterium]
MDTVKAYKCPNCKAGLEFNPANQNWKCQYCFGEFSKEQLDAVLQPEEPLEQAPTELNSYRCSSCGAELIADATTSATFCLYCKNHTIIKSRFAGEFKPERLIPFKLTKEQAKELYRKWITKRLFAPDDFKQKDKLDKVTGVYAPFWLFDCKVDGMIEGEGTRVRTWSDADYKYTETKYYRVVRGGSTEYNRVPVDASIKLDDQFMHLIEPYNYGDLTEFSMEYLSGFMAEKYDVEAAAAETVMAERVSQYLEDRLTATVSGYSSFTVSNKLIQLKDTIHEYAMLPIYLLINQYQGKDHVFIVNGQTGKVVGDTPTSFAKQLLFAGAVFFGVWLVLVLGGALFA